jgi:hypothetical protein
LIKLIQGHEIQGHEIKSAASQGWTLMVNGDLIAAAEKFGFDVMITADQGIEYQQNLKDRRIAWVVLSTNHWATLRAGAARIAKGLDSASPGEFLKIRFDVDSSVDDPPPEH